MTMPTAMVRRSPSGRWYEAARSNRRPRPPTSSAKAWQARMAPVRTDRVLGSGQPPRPPDCPLVARIIRGALPPASPAVLVQRLPATQLRVGPQRPAVRTNSAQHPRTPPAGSPHQPLTLPDAVRPDSHLHTVRRAAATAKAHVVNRPASQRRPPAGKAGLAERWGRPCAGRWPRRRGRASCHSASITYSRCSRRTVALQLGFTITSAVLQVALARWAYRSAIPQRAAVAGQQGVPAQRCLRGRRPVVQDPEPGSIELRRGT